MENGTKNGWHATEMATHVAIHPDYEDEHVISTTCWCGTRIETQDRETGELFRIPVVFHRDISERNGGPPLTDIKDDDD